MDPRDRRRTIWLAGLGHAMAHSWELLFPALAVPMAADLDLPYAKVVTLSYLCYLLFGLGAVPAGLLTDRVGARPVLLACLIGGGASGCLVAVSSSNAWLVVSLGGLGLAASLYHPAGLALLSRQFPGGMGRAFAINGIAGNVGIAATPFAAGLAASMFGWRAAFAILCVPALIAGLVLLALPFTERGDELNTAEDAPGRQPWFRWTPVLILAAAVTFGGLAYRLHTLVAPALIQERMPRLMETMATAAPAWMSDVENLTATALMSFAYATGIAGQLWGGRVADRHALAPAYVLFHLAALPMLLGAAYVAGVGLFPLFIAYLFFAQGMQPIENSLVARLVPPRWRGRVFAGKFLLAFGVGSTGVWIVALVTPHLGLGGALVCAAGFELLLVLAAIALWRTLRGHQPNTRAVTRT